MINQSSHVQRFRNHAVDDSQSPNTVKAILDNLPIEVNINKRGKELYTDKTLIRAQEENAKSEVNLLDVAF